MTRTTKIHATRSVISATVKIYGVQALKPDYGAFFRASNSRKSVFPAVVIAVTTATWGKL